MFLHFYLCAAEGGMSYWVSEIDDQEEGSCHQHGDCIEGINEVFCLCHQPYGGVTRGFACPMQLIYII